MDTRSTAFLKTINWKIKDNKIFPLKNLSRLSDRLSIKIWESAIMEEQFAFYFIFYDTFNFNCFIFGLEILTAELLDFWANNLLILLRQILYCFCNSF